MLDAAAGTPFLSLAGSNSMIGPPEGTRRWAFKLNSWEGFATAQQAEHIQRAGVTTLGIIGISTRLGDSFFAVMRTDAAAQGKTIVDEQRYNPGGASVVPQVLRPSQSRPGAVFIAGNAAAAALPVTEPHARGFNGPIYTVMGIAGPDALRVGGKALDGVLPSSVPLPVAEQLGDANPAKPEAARFVQAYDAKYGPGSRNVFGANLGDSFRLRDAEAGQACAAARPGTLEFRGALRDGMEGVRGLPATEGGFDLSPADHSGAQAASQVMIEIRGGSYRLVSP